MTDTPEVEWETVADPLRAVVARCALGHLRGTYWDVAGNGSWEPGRCRCAPAPELPSGAQLDSLIERASRSGRAVQWRCRSDR